MTRFVRGRASRDTVGALRPLCGEDPLQCVCLTVGLSPLSLLPLTHQFLCQGSQSSPPHPILDKEEDGVGEIVGCAQSPGPPRMLRLGPV